MTHRTVLERSLLLPVSAGVTIAMAAITVALFRQGTQRLILGTGGVAASGATAALYFADPRPPEAFFQGFGAGIAVGAALCFVLCLKTLFIWGLPQARWPYQPSRQLTARVAITLATYGALCVAASRGHPGQPHLWPTAGLVLGYCCSARILFPVMIGPAWLVYIPAQWFLAASSGVLPWRLTPALRSARARGWLLPGRSFRDPLLQRFLAAEAEQSWSQPSARTAKSDHPRAHAARSTP